MPVVRRPTLGAVLLRIECATCGFSTVTEKQTTKGEAIGLSCDHCGTYTAIEAGPTKDRGTTTGQALAGSQDVPGNVVPPQARTPLESCPRCAQRRIVNAKAQQRWRARAKP